MSFPLCQILSVFCRAMKTPRKKTNCFDYNWEEKIEVSSWCKAPAQEDVWRGHLGDQKRHLFYFLPRPEPPKGACSEQSVNESIEDVFQVDDPVFTLPNGILDQRHTISHESNSSGNSKYSQIIRTRCSRPASQISDKDAHQ